MSSELSEQELVQSSKFDEEWKKHPLRKPRLAALIINSCVGESGPRFERAKEILRQITNKEPVERYAKKTVRGFGIRKGENIAVKVTLRNSKARDIIERLMIERDYKILKKSFDDHGNVSFGVSEHINVPGMKYDPNIGIFGFDVSIRLVRPGYRVRTRKIKRARIPRKQYVSKEETMLFMEEEFKAEIVEKIEIFWY